MHLFPLFLGVPVAMFGLGALLLLVALAIPAATGPAPEAGSPQPDPALELLRRRLASGDITVEQYEAARRALEGG